jgi:hypothetical protein
VNASAKLHLSFGPADHDLGGLFLGYPGTFQVNQNGSLRHDAAPDLSPYYRDDSGMLELPPPPI